MLSISDDSFLALQRFLERESGIVVSDSKRYLIEVRLAPLLREEGLQDFDALVLAMNGVHGRRLGVRIIESMTTHETLWFRDRFPFDFFRDVIIPEFLQSGSPALKVWSAACATGQEPYSLSMLVEEAAETCPRLAQAVKIMATDISESALQIAREGRYDALSLRRGLDDQRLQRFFIEDSKSWKTRPTLASRITFRPLNLLANFSHLGHFDVVFCRNVLIYFSSISKQETLDRVIQAIRPGGYLVLGASETVPEALTSKHHLVRQNLGGGIYLKASG
ncbi:MAG: protein-glutamate O-methyltransferase CheR [Pseudomonadota bacterium]